MKEYRDNGAIGALLDEYEKAMYELIAQIEDLNEETLVQIVDPDTNDPDCRSIQTILTHVIFSGHNYALYIRNSTGETGSYDQKIFYKNIPDYIEALWGMFEVNVNIFKDYPNIFLNEKTVEKKIFTRWKQRYSVEQLMEHAIVHVLRHRRQIARFRIKLGIPLK